MNEVMLEPGSMYKVMLKFILRVEPMNYRIKRFPNKLRDVGTHFKI